jgi:hypothetical protein
LKIDALPAEREASGSPLEGGWIKLSSIKIRNPKMGHGSSQIFTDKLV